MTDNEKKLYEWLKNKRSEWYTKQSSLNFQLKQCDAEIEDLTAQITQIEKEEEFNRNMKAEQLANDYTHGDYLFHNQLDNDNQTD